jgi:hypothetical protein
MSTYPTTDIAVIKVLFGPKYQRFWRTFEQSRRVHYFYQDIDKHIVSGFIDESFYTASKGILWSIDTCRVGGIFVAWIRSLRVPQLIDLLGEVREHCPTMTDVADYLAKMRFEAVGALGDGRYRRIRERDNEPTSRR